MMQLCGLVLQQCTAALKSTVLFMCDTVGLCLQGWLCSTSALDSGLSNQVVGTHATCMSVWQS